MSLCSLRDLVARAGPRVVGPKSSDPPALVFTDGACEDEVSIGAVLVLPDGHLEVFGAVLDQVAVNSWKRNPGQVQVIGQAELFPLLVARLTWAKHLQGKRVIFFVDNEGARLGAIKG
eukprot:11963214-Karenia_brevis.AAC.1